MTLRKIGVVVIVFAMMLLGIPSISTAVTTPLDVSFSELDFEYARSVNVASSVVPLSARCTTSSSVNCVGKNQGDKVLFTGVATLAGQRIDALVTTTNIGANTRVRFYEVRSSYPEWENNPKWFWVNVVNDAGGITAASFAIDFFVGGTYANGAGTAATLKNFQMTGVEIDNSQNMKFHGGSSYTVAADTKLSVDVDEVAGTMNFQGPSTNSDEASSPLHQAVVTYGARTGVTVDLGRKPSAANSTFAIAFKELSWSGVPTETTDVAKDPQGCIEYNINGGEGTTPAKHTGAFGEEVPVHDGSGFDRNGYEFAGWNTAADGSGVTFTSRDQFTLTTTCTTLYAQWVKGDVPTPEHPKSQEPLKPVRLPESIPSAGTVTIVKAPVVTNAGQVAKVRVKCQTLLRGDVKPCKVRRSGGRVTLTTAGYAMDVTVKLHAPAVGKYTAYDKEKSYKVR